MKIHENVAAKMSRIYIMRGCVKGISEASLFRILYNWCGYDQILRLKMINFDERISFWCEVGCSSGVDINDTTTQFGTRLTVDGAEEIELRVWSLHQDDSVSSFNITGNENE